MKNAKELTENEIRTLERGQVELVSNSNKLDSRGEFEHRGIAVALELCRMEDNAELVVHFKNGKIDYVEFNLDLWGLTGFAANSTYAATENSRTWR